MSEKLKLKLTPGRTLAESMRSIPFAEVVKMVRLCCLSAACKLPEDVEEALIKLCRQKPIRWRRNY